MSYVSQLTSAARGKSLQYTKNQDAAAGARRRETTDKDVIKLAVRGNEVENHIIDKKHTHTHWWEILSVFNVVGASVCMCVCVRRAST